jgi:hypothetical protein
MKLNENAAGTVQLDLSGEHGRLAKAPIGVDSWLELKKTENK